MDQLEDNNGKFQEIASEEKDEKEDTSTYKIFSYGADYTLSVLYDKMKSGEIVTPDFQRRYVWKIEQASKLIESFLLGLPVPGIFLSKDPISENLIVIDGQQRLVTCQSFRDLIFPKTGEPFKLTDVNKKWNGKTYTELESADRIRFDDSVLRATIIQQIKPDDNTSVYHIFQRLNTGGTILQNQEIRNSLYHGSFNDLLKRLNEVRIWRLLFGKKTPDLRMKDEELILRFFALYYNFDNYTKPMNEFISDFMAKHRNPSEEELSRMEVLFLETITKIHDEIGGRAFRPKGSINTAAYDSVMYTISKNLDNLKDNLGKEIDDLFANEDYLNTISLATTDEVTIQRRMALTKKFLVKT